MNSPRKLPDPKSPAHPVVKFSCGHARPLREVENALCGTCRIARRQAKAEAQRAKQELKQDQKAGFRFPDETEFTSRWNGEVWVGHLMVPGVPTIGHTHTNLHTMQREMKAMYEAALTTLPEKPDSRK